MHSAAREDCSCTVPLRGMNANRRAAEPATKWPDCAERASVKLQREPRRKENKKLLKRYYIKIWSWTPCACQNLRSHRSQRPNGTNITDLRSSAVLSSHRYARWNQRHLKCACDNSNCPSKRYLPTASHTSLGKRRLKSNRERKKWQQ